MRQTKTHTIRVHGKAQTHEHNLLTGESDNIYFCRCCGLKMYEPNKGFQYMCADCHEAVMGWCQMSSLIDSVIDHRNALIKKLDAAEMQGFFDGFYYCEVDECFKRLE